jgi:large subunit ribosomal protein L15
MVFMHLIKRAGKNKVKRRLGRGGKRGTYSGRGQKGQRARAGRNIRSQERESLLKIPQKRGVGFDRRSRNRALAIAVIDLAVINRAYKEGEIVSPKTLISKGIVGRNFGRRPRIKILGAGEVTKRLAVKNCDVSASAGAKIKAQGGTC